MAIHKITDGERENGYIKDQNIFLGISSKQVFDRVELHCTDGDVKTYSKHRVSSRHDAINKDGKFRMHETTPDRLDGLSEVYKNLALGVTKIDVTISCKNKETVLEIHEIYDADAKNAAAAAIQEMLHQN